MRAVCWAGRNKVEVRDVPDPAIMNRRDAIVRVSSAVLHGPMVEPHVNVWPDDLLARRGALHVVKAERHSIFFEQRIDP